ncbi:MAG: hypothetical protein M3P50_11295, partial [Actinomycetota bacterium]|nr:hypothetical protein [Actinomycetota bacterium]
MSVRSKLRWACVGLAGLLAWASPARAAEVVELGRDGRARVIEDRFVPSRPDLPAVPRAPRA